MNTDFINICLADDDEDDRLFFTDAFDELKINTKVSTFKDGVELMDFLNNADSILPNVLFLDLNMPKKNGVECLLEIKKNANLNDIAIAIYSTSSSEEHIEETFVNGANIYIKNRANAFKFFVISDKNTILAGQMAGVPLKKNDYKRPRITS